MVVEAVAVDVVYLKVLWCVEDEAVNEFAFHSWCVGFDTVVPVHLPFILAKPLIVFIVHHYLPFSLCV